MLAEEAWRRRPLLLLLLLALLSRLEVSAQNTLYDSLQSLQANVVKLAHLELSAGGATSAIEEGSAGTADEAQQCSWECYLMKNPTVAQAAQETSDRFAYASDHYRHVGQSEGRSCTCNGMRLFDQLPGPASGSARGSSDEHIDHTSSDTFAQQVRNCTCELVHQTAVNFGMDPEEKKKIMGCNDEPWPSPMIQDSCPNWDQPVQLPPYKTIFFLSDSTGSQLSKTLACVLGRGVTHIKSESHQEKLAIGDQRGSIFQVGNQQVVQLGIGLGFSKHDPKLFQDSYEKALQILKRKYNEPTTLLVVQQGTHHNLAPGGGMGELRKFVQRISKFVADEDIKMHVNWLESFPQHFDTDSGAFNQDARSNNCKSEVEPADGQLARIAANKHTQFYRITPVYDEHIFKQEIPVLKAWDTLAALGKLHYGFKGDGFDCTHYKLEPLMCLSHSLSQQMWSMNGGQEQSKGKRVYKQENEGKGEQRHQEYKVEKDQEEIGDPNDIYNSNLQQTKKSRKRLVPVSDEVADKFTGEDFF